MFQRKPLKSLDVNQIRLTPSKDGNGPLESMKQLADSLPEKGPSGVAEVTPKKRRIDDRDGLKENSINMGTPVKLLSGAQGLPGTPVGTPLRGSAKGVSNLSFSKTPPRSKSDVDSVRNGGQYSTPRSNNKRKAGLADSGVGVKNMDLLEPKDIYPPEGESAVPEGPILSANLRSTLVERLKSIEENLTQLNKEEPSVTNGVETAAMAPPFMEQPPSSSASKARKERHFAPNVGMPLPPRGKGVEEKAKDLRETLASARADIERAKKHTSPSPTKKNRLPVLESEALDATAVSTGGVAFKEQLAEADVPLRPSAEGQDGGGGDGKTAGVRKTKNKAKSVDDPLSGIPLHDRPVHTLSHIEFRARVISARVAAAGTLLRCKDKACAQQSYIEKQLEHYHSLNRGTGDDKEGYEDKETGEPAFAKRDPPAVEAEAALVECLDSVPLLPLGEQRKSPASIVTIEPPAPILPLTEMTLLQDKVNSWKQKYSPSKTSVSAMEQGEEQGREQRASVPVETPLKTENEAGDAGVSHSPYNIELPPPAPPLSDDEISI